MGGERAGLHRGVSTAVAAQPEGLDLERPDYANYYKAG